MSPYDRSLVQAARAPQETSSNHSAYDYAIFEEFSFVRREAQAEADLAYSHWRGNPCTDAYLVYRAAQDRADAAQDALAQWSGRLSA